MPDPQKTKVLIVDDEPNIVMSLDYLFRRKGFEVYIGRDGEEAMKILDNTVPDLLLLDIMMPKVNGYEVCRYVKSQAALAGCKVVFMSAKSKSSDIDKGLEMGADLYIPKPFSTRDLMKKVQQLLG